MQHRVHDMNPAGERAFGSGGGKPEQRPCGPAVTSQQRHKTGEAVVGRFRNSTDHPGLETNTHLRCRTKDRAGLGMQHVHVSQVSEAEKRLFSSSCARLGMRVVLRPKTALSFVRRHKGVVVACSPRCCCSGSIDGELGDLARGLRS